MQKNYISSILKHFKISQIITSYIPFYHLYCWKIRTGNQTIRIMAKNSRIRKNCSLQVSFHYHVAISSLYPSDIGALEIYKYRGIIDGIMEQSCSI